MSSAANALDSSKSSSVFWTAAPYVASLVVVSGVCLTAGAIAIIAATSSVGFAAISLYAAGAYAGVIGIGSTAMLGRVVKDAVSSKTPEEFLQSKIVAGMNKQISSLMANLKKNPLAFVYGTVALSVAGAGLAVSIIYATPIAIVAGSALAVLSVLFLATIAMHLNSKYHLPNSYSSSLLKFSACYLAGFFVGGKDDPLQKLKTVDQTKA